MPVSAAMDAADRSLDWSSICEIGFWQEQEVRAASARHASGATFFTYQRCRKYSGVCWRTVDSAAPKYVNRELMPQDSEFPKLGVAVGALLSEWHNFLPE